MVFIDGFLFNDNFEVRERFFLLLSIYEESILKYDVFSASGSNHHVPCIYIQYIYTCIYRMCYINLSGFDEITN